ncbi:hypothetical protein, partial [Merdimonas faecis]|uniref:hypothetical protein n=1 Tax=Merdimonas faecis TaxID=1653435 RepID=UPI0023FA09DE
DNTIIHIWFLSKKIFPHRHRKFYALVYYQSQRSHDDACETLFHLYYQQQEEIDQIKERLALTS